VAFHRLYIEFTVHFKYYKTHNRFGLAWSRPRAERGLSRPTSVFRATIGVCKILSRSVEDLAVYEGQKAVFKQNGAKHWLGRQKRHVDCGLKRRVKWPT